MGSLQTIIRFLNANFPLLIIWFLGSFFTLFITFATYRHSGTRGAVASVVHLLILTLGWLLGNWVGLLLISIPLLVFYYYLMFHFAMVVVPPSTPESWQERWQRARLLLWYSWGFQYPVWVVTDSTGRNVEERISGSPFQRQFAPGLVLALSNQVVGLTSGITFSGIRGPGVVFTRAFERPFSIVDLRTQLRTSWIDVVSSDGIPYQALLFTAFAVDKEKWDRDTYHQLRGKDDSLRDWKEPDCTSGSYPFSRARLRALFSTIGIRSVPDTKPTRAHWDERVLYQIEQSMREVLSQLTLDELWLPKDNYKGASAIDTIDKEVKGKCALLLLKRGVRLYTSRIVDFKFPTKNLSDPIDGKSDQAHGGRAKPPSDEIGNEYEIERQQIYLWGADWQREAAQTRARGKAEADFLTQEARAYAYATLLTAVAEGIQKTRQLNPELLPRVIAMRFISVLEELMNQQPGESDNQEAYSALYGLKQIFKDLGE